MRKRFTVRDARSALARLRRRLPRKATLRDLARGMSAELEHRDVTGSDALLSAKIALAHLKERPDYYDLLARLEKSPRTRANPRKRYAVGPDALQLLVQHGIKIPMALYVDAANSPRGIARLETQVSRAYVDQYRSRDTAEFLFVFFPRKRSVEDHPLPGERADLYEQVARAIRQDARYDGYRYLGDDLYGGDPYGTIEHRLRLGG